MNELLMGHYVKTKRKPLYNLCTFITRSALEEKTDLCLTLVTKCCRAYLYGFLEIQHSLTFKTFLRQCLKPTREDFQKYASYAFMTLHSAV